MHSKPAYRTRPNPQDERYFRMAGRFHLRQLRRSHDLGTFFKKLDYTLETNFVLQNFMHIIWFMIHMIHLRATK